MVLSGPERRRRWIAAEKPPKGQGGKFEEKLADQGYSVDPPLCYAAGLER